MTIILFLLGTIYSNIFRSNYLRKKDVFSISVYIFEIHIEFLKISKKIWPSKVIYFWTDLLRKMWLDKCLKSSISEDPSTRNMANGPKHCWSLNSSTFVIFIDHCERNSVVKSLSWWYEKYKDCFLTHWLPMTSILFLIETIYRNIFRCNYLENNRNFHNFLFHLGNLDSTLNILKKKDDPHRWCIFELTDFEKCG